MILSIIRDKFVVQSNQYITDMMLTRRSVYRCVAWCAIVVVTACNTHRQSDDKGFSAQATCDTSILSNYRHMVATTKDPIVLSRQIIHYYDHVEKPCRGSLASPMLHDLFDILYTYSNTDTVLLPFLNKLSAEEYLSPTQRRRALLNASGFYLYSRYMPDSALNYLNRVISMKGQVSDSSLKTYHSQMAEYMRQKSRLKEASDHFLKTIRLAEKLKDSVALAGSYANYGTLFSNMGEHRKSIAMKQKALAFFRQRDQKDNVFIGYVGIGVEYGNLREYDSAMAYYRKAVQMTEEGMHNPNIEFDLYISMGGISLGLNQFDTARYFYSKARETFDFGRDVRRTQVYIMASTPAFAAVRDVSKEKAMIRSYIPTFYADSNLADARDAHYTLYHINYIEHNFEEALSNYTDYDSLKSLQARAENRQYAAEMEAKYETQKKELKIEVQQKEIKRNNILNGLLIASLLVVVLSAAFIITRIKLKRKKKEAELQQQFTRRLLNNTEEERERIAKDLHDGISQELLILKQQITSDQLHTNEKIDAIIHEIRMISRDLHPVMLDKIGLKLSIEHICQQMMESNLLFITADITYNMSLDKAVELQLFRMIQEALNNIVKYADAQAAKVTITETGGYVITEIIDNGKGFDVTAAMESKNSFGLLNLTERAKALNGKTDIISSSTGTSVRIEIPVRERTA